jgi:hypothetical protein
VSRRSIVFKIARVNDSIVCNDTRHHIYGLADAQYGDLMTIAPEDRPTAVVDWFGDKVRLEWGILVETGPKLFVKRVCAL